MCHLTKHEKQQNAENAQIKKQQNDENVITICH